MPVFGRPSARLAADRRPTPARGSATRPSTSSTIVAATIGSTHVSPISTNAFGLPPFRGHGQGRHDAARFRGSGPRKLADHPGAACSAQPPLNFSVLAAVEGEPDRLRPVDPGAALGKSSRCHAGGSSSIRYAARNRCVAVSRTALNQRRHPCTWYQRSWNGPRGLSRMKSEVRPLLVGQGVRIRRVRDVRLAAVVKFGLVASPAPRAADQQHVLPPAPVERSHHPLRRGEAPPSVTSSRTSSRPPSRADAHPAARTHVRRDEERRDPLDERAARRARS